MDTAMLRKQLHDYLEIADDDKVEAIYTMVEQDINVSNVEYTAELKAELNQRVQYYLDGGKMVMPDEMNSRLKAVRAKRQ